MSQNLAHRTFIDGPLVKPVPRIKQERSPRRQGKRATCAADQRWRQKPRTEPAGRKCCNSKLALRTGNRHSPLDRSKASGTVVRLKGGPPIAILISSSPGDRLSAHAGPAMARTELYHPERARCTRQRDLNASRWSLAFSKAGRALKAGKTGSMLRKATSYTTYCCSPATAHCHSHV